MLVPSSGRGRSALLPERPLNRGPWLRRASALAVWLLCSVGTASAVDVERTGADGAAGAHASTPGKAGGAGTAGRSATAQNLGSLDLSDTATANGGRGGEGGNGAAGSATLRGGAAGAGGAGGDAVAIGQRLTGGAEALRAIAVGGAGGSAGLPGATRGAGIGAGAAGGMGGLASSRATLSALTLAPDTAGGLESLAAAMGGQGGDAYGLGGVAGSGGRATGQARVDARWAHYALARVEAQGGAGGVGWQGATGGQGGSVALSQAVTGGSALGTLALQQQATGGQGGDSDSGSAGHGGDAASVLDLVDLTATTLDVYISAYGGNGGSAATGAAGRGGQAEAQLTVAHVGSLYMEANATGGSGGSGAGSAAQDGAAQVTLRGRATGDLFIRATASSQSEVGPLGSSGRARADALGEGQGAVSVDSNAVGSSEAHATAVAKGTSQTAGVEAVATARSANVAIARASSHHTTDARSPDARSTARATAFGTQAQAEADSTTVYRGERAMTLQARVAVQGGGPAGDEALASTGMGGNAPRAGSGYPRDMAQLNGLPDSSYTYAPSSVWQAMGDGEALVHGLLSLHNASGSPDQQTRQASARLKTTLAPGETALLGLLRFSPYGAYGDLADFTFSVDNHGTTLFSRSFSSNQQAWDYFEDHAITLTGVEGEIDLGLHLTLNGSLPQSLGFDFVVGAVPEVSTQVMMAMAFCGMFAVRRWQMRRSGASGADGAA